MTVPNKLSGYIIQSPIELQRQHLIYQNPGSWIQGAFDDMPLVLNGKGRDVESLLDVVNTCTQEILNSVGLGRAADAQGQAIDFNTQINELNQLVSDVHIIQESVRHALKNDQNLTRYALGFPSKQTAKTRLLQECDRSTNLVKQMIDAAAALKETPSKTKALTEVLLSTIETLPKDCLGIVVKYSIF